MPSYTSGTNRALTAFLVALALVAGGLSIAVLMAHTAEARPAPVSLEPATEPGAHPFVPSLSSGTAAPDPAAPADSAGTGDQYTCDPQVLIDYLGAHPDAAAAWVDALDSDPTLTWSGGDSITVDQIPAYIGELTPAVLGDDMRVTNYRFVGGSAGSVQSVLQKDTAVLMDARGVPRVRCACGNPLTPARAIAGDVDYEGTPWPDFAPVDITVGDGDSDAGDHPSCDRHQRWDGDQCVDVRRCPPRLTLGDDGRCHRDATPCPSGQTHDRHGVCRPDGTPPMCPAGTAARTGQPCPPACPSAVPTATTASLPAVCPAPVCPPAPLTPDPVPAATAPPVGVMCPLPVPADPAPVVPPADPAPAPQPEPPVVVVPVDPVTSPPPVPLPEPVPDPQPVDPKPSPLPVDPGAINCTDSATGTAADAPPCPPAT